MHYVFSIITRCNNTYQWILFFQPYHFLFTILKIVFFKYANSFVLKYAPTNIKLGTITTISIRRTKFKIVFSIKFSNPCLKYKNGLTLNKSLYTIMGLIIVLIKPYTIVPTYTPGNPILFIITTETTKFTIACKNAT